jgi:restriction system protein
MNKKKELLKLAQLRQTTRYEGYNCLADYVDGFYECDYVSPYSKSANNINADIFIVLQDWSSDENMQDKCEKTKELGYTPSVATNIKLNELLNNKISVNLKDTYTTNLFPFIKMGGLSSNISIKDMRKAAKQFTIPMIDIIKPKIVIALGRKTYDAIYDNCYEKGQKYSDSFIYGNTKIFHQPHPAARITNFKKERKWNEMYEYLQSKN